VSTSESLELDPVEWITAGAVGEPGDRTFYVQAEDATRRVSLLAEKQQVSQLAQASQELLSEAGITVTPDDLDEAVQRLREPLDPLWRVGQMSLGKVNDEDRYVLEAYEVGDEDEVAEPESGEPGGGVAVARFWMDGERLVAMSAHAAYAIEAGSRATCRLCGRPIEPTGTHVCPAQNGHGSLSR